MPLAVLEQALSQVRAEYVAEGKADLFDCLQPFLSGDKSTIGYQGIGAGLGMSEGAVKVAVNRLRKRYGQMLRTQIEQTVASPEEVADEIRHLIRAAAG